MPAKKRASRRSVVDPDDAPAWTAEQFARAEVPWAARSSERAYHAATHALDDVAALILATPARSGAALAVKARATKLWGKPEWWSPQASHADPYERFAAQILDLFVQQKRVDSSILSPEQSP